MAAVSVSAQNTRLDDAETTTDWAKQGGGGSGALETDFFYQNANCYAVKGGLAALGVYLSDNVDTDLTPPSVNRKTVLFKYIVTTPGLLELLSVPGIRLQIGSGSTVSSDPAHYYYYDVQGSDTYPITSSWLILPINPNVVAHRTGTTGTPDLTVADTYGILADQTGTSKSPNIGLDAVDLAEGLTLIGGDGASTDGNFDDFLNHDWGTVNNRYGYIREVEGLYLVYGCLIIGTSTATEFTDTGQVVVFPDGLFEAGFSCIELGMQNTGNAVTWSGCTFIGRGDETGEDTRPDLRVVGSTSTAGLTATACTWDTHRRLKLSNDCTLDTCTIVNSGQVDPTNEDYTGSVDLPGTDEYVDTTTNPVIDGGTSNDFEIIMLVKATDWTPTSVESLMAQYRGSAALTNFRFQLLTTNALRLIVGDGTLTTTHDSNVPSPVFVDDTWHWIRVTYDYSAGQANFFHSYWHIDTPVGDITWTAIGTPTGTQRDIHSLATQVTIGAENGSSPTAFFDGEIAYVEMYVDGFQAPGASYGTRIFRGDWRTGAAWSTTRNDDWSTAIAWELQGTTPTYNAADNRIGTADLENSSIRNSTSESALRLNVSTIGATSLDGLSFESSGTGHAIEFGKSAPSSITFDAHSYTSYAGTDGDTGNEVIFNDSGKNIRVTVATNGDIPTIRNGTSATTLVVATVTVSIHVEDESGTAVEDAQVYVQRATYTKNTCSIGNSAGDPDLVVTTAIPSDQAIPGSIIVHDDSAGTAHPYRYNTITGSNTYDLLAEITGNTTSAGGSTGLISTSTNFLTEDIEEGDMVRNTTSGDWAVVDEIVDANNITTSPLVGPGDNNWDSGDAFSFHRLATAYGTSDTVDECLLNGQTDASGDIDFTYDKTEAPTNVIIRVRSQQGATKYKDIQVSGTISATIGLTVSIALAEDTIAA